MSTMLLSSVAAHIRALRPINITADVIKEIVSLIDLTSLNATDTVASVALFCKKAYTPFGCVAAVCVYPQFVSLVATEFAHTPIKVATVCNFPDGTAPLENVLTDIQLALMNGAQEIDVVFPYPRYLAGDKDYAQHFVAACKAACGEQILLKVILETGQLNDLTIIAEASKTALLAGADFIKTSTGKVSHGASLEAAATILSVIQDLSPHLKQSAGIKISGGVRELEQAAYYLQLAENIMGTSWVSPASFRIGASGLVDAIHA